MASTIGLFPIDLPRKVDFYGKLEDSIGFYPMKVGYPKTK